MLHEYKLKGSTKKIEIEIETKVADTLKKMEAFTKLTQSEIANTALKRFIAAHKDFLSNVDSGPSAQKNSS